MFKKEQRGCLTGLRTAFIVATCALMLLGLRSVPLCSASTEDDARSAMAAAQQRVAVCYIAVAEADGVGANITDLLSTLDDAGMLLSRAHLAFQNGTFESAYNLSVQSKAALEGFEVQADSLKDAAEHNNSVDFWVNIVGSSVGTVGVVAGGFAVWLWLKKRHG